MLTRRKMLEVVAGITSLGGLFGRKEEVVETSSLRSSVPLMGKMTPCTPPPLLISSLTYTRVLAMPMMDKEWIQIRERGRVWGLCGRKVPTGPEAYSEARRWEDLENPLYLTELLWSRLNRILTTEAEYVQLFGDGIDHHTSYQFCGRPVLIMKRNGRELEDGESFEYWKKHREKHRISMDELRALWRREQTQIKEYYRKRGKEILCPQ